MTSSEYCKNLFLRTLAQVDVGNSIAAQLSCSDGVLRIGKRIYPIDGIDDFLIIAMGKAAHPMAEAALKALEPHVKKDRRLTGIVASGTQPLVQRTDFRYFIGGHPTPDQQSRDAAEAILATLAQAGARTFVLFLISGGSSAMVEKPLDKGISVAETASFYRALVHSGLPITQINSLRKHFSAIKGGRLAQAAGDATQVTLVVSDVPEDALNMVGSGPSMPDTSTIAECRRILAASQMTPALSPAVLELLLSPTLPETAKPGARAFEKAEYLSVLSNSDLLREAGALAAADGFHVVIDNTCDDWNYELAGAYLLERLGALTAEHGRVCLLSGGELSVPLPVNAGKGGRNQQFALWCALRLQRTGEIVTVLSGGTDGIDGNSPAAGACVDQETCKKAQQAGIDPGALFAGFDSFTFFSKVGSALMTGPTGNNVRDLRILLSGFRRSRDGEEPV